MVRPSKPSMSWPKRARPSSVEARAELRLGRLDQLRAPRRDRRPLPGRAGSARAPAPRLRPASPASHADRSGGIVTLSIGTPVSVWNSIAAVSRSSLRLGHAGARRLQPLFGLLLVGDRDRALRHAFAKIAGKPFVEGGIVLGDRDQPLLQQIVDVGAATLSATNSLRSSIRAAAPSVRAAWRRISAARPPLSIQQLVDR